MFLTLIISKALSQNSAISNAIYEREVNNLPEAKKEIDKAVLHEKTSIKPEAWYNRGLIYTDIFISKDPAIKMLSDSAAQVALTSFNKAIALENKEKGIHTKNSKEGLANLYVYTINEGVGNFEKKDMANAKRNFLVALGAKPSDTIAATNVLVACQQLKDTLCIIDGYKKMIDSGKEKSEYYYWTYLYYQKRDTTLAYKALEDGIAKYPNNKLFAQNYIEELFAAKKYGKVKDKLVALTKAEPTNKFAKLKLAVTYEALNDLDNSEQQYKDVLAIEPANSMSLFNLGIIQYRKALMTLGQKDGLKSEERATKGKEIDEKYKKTLYDAAKNFEEYRKNKPNDGQSKQVLTDIYKRLKRDDMIQLLK